MSVTTATVDARKFDTSGRFRGTAQVTVTAVTTPRGTPKSVVLHVNRGKGCSAHLHLDPQDWAKLTEVVSSP
jgi:hypothetical protein